ncbi:hypothetical protein CRG98_011030 [Punica granatum]|uniref:Uncharacterized protein n=1 Tax=Punica granatum TaxID=22663 RepID=A0A2I0KJ71_PUNGR|nr:hypothetical protein CRG98_011030 [Punica granatum]
MASPCPAQMHLTEADMEGAEEDLKIDNAFTSPRSEFVWPRSRNGPIRPKSEPGSGPKPRLRSPNSKPSPARLFFLLTRRMNPNFSLLPVRLLLRASIDGPPLASSDKPACPPSELRSFHLPPPVGRVADLWLLIVELPDCRYGLPFRRTF